MQMPYGINKMEEMPCTLAIPQTGNISAHDYLYSKDDQNTQNIKIVPADKAVGLHFSHVMCRVDFKVIKDRGMGALVELGKISIFGSEISNIGTFNLLTSTYDKGNNSAPDKSINIVEMQPSEILQTNFDDAKTFSIVCNPTSVINKDDGSEAKFSFTVKMGASGNLMEKVFSSSVKRGFQFEPGKHYTFNVSLSENGVGIEGSIQDWEDGGEIS